MKLTPILIKIIIGMLIIGVLIFIGYDKNAPQPQSFCVIYINIDKTNLNSSSVIFMNDYDIENCTTGVWLEGLPK